MNIVTVGIDLAKNIFAFHGVDQNGKAVLVKPKVRREQVLEMDRLRRFVAQPTCGVIYGRGFGRCRTTTGQVEAAIEIWKPPKSVPREMGGVAFMNNPP